MLRINRLKINVKTTEGDYGFDETFDKRINFIASYSNTKGKSSCIEAIYYCLGIEELIGGKNEKALKPVFRKVLENNGVEIPVLETNFYLEIVNADSKIVTVFRPANKENYSSNLVTIFYGSLDDLNTDMVLSEDMYLHLNGAATNKKGYHRFLEGFIKWELPTVPTYDDQDRKLYLQTVFSALFIEQKRGWSDLFATLPTYLRLKEPQKRIIEFLIGLETLKNEKLKQEYKMLESEIKTEWERAYKDLHGIFNKVNFTLHGLPALPTILDELFINQTSISKSIDNDKELLLTEHIDKLKNVLSSLNEKNTNIGENIEDLQLELISIKQNIMENEKILNEKNNENLFIKGNIENLTVSLEIINKDILNNKDALKLKKLGSSVDWAINKDICPTCHQNIHDSLLPQDVDYNFMSIEENIQHLESQKSMIDFAIISHKGNINHIINSIKQIEFKLITQRKIAHSITNDIYSNDEMKSETVIRKKIMIENQIEQLEEKLKIYSEDILVFKGLSERWKTLISNKTLLPTQGLTKRDKDILELLNKTFVKNLVNFGYSSIVDTSTIQISENKFLPVTEGFDMKFDSSASDNIRAIWAYTLALMQTSNGSNGSHPNLLIFDEPDQQSIVVEDMNNFFQTIINLKSECQVIIGITIKDEETKNVINKLDKTKFKLILLKEKAIEPN